VLAEYPTDAADATTVRFKTHREADREDVVRGKVPTPVDVKSGPKWAV
jgi:hypothetical protein